LSDEDRSFADERRAGAEARAREAAGSRRQVYALVGLFMVSVLVIGIVLAILSAGVGGQGSWWQKVTMTHTPVQKGSIGQDIEITAKVLGLPKNVTLSYMVIPNNASFYTYRFIKPNNVYMLLTAAGGDQYSYTITGTEVLGDITYSISASDSYGNSAVTQTFKISIDDFNVEWPAKELSVYVTKTATVPVTIRSFNSFVSAVSLRCVALGLNALPGGLAAEFRPASVTPGPGGVVTSQLVIRSTSTTFIPSGLYNVKVEAWASTQRGTVTRNSSIAILKVPDFDFTVSPTSQSVVRQVINQITERVTPFNITVNIQEGFESNLQFRVAGLPNTGVYYRWVIGNANWHSTGATLVNLEIVTQSVATVGSYTLTIYVTGGGFEKFKQVSFIIQESTQT